MKRRTCLQLASAAFLGCGKSRAADAVRLQAGPFSVSVPSDWSATAIVEKVPLDTLYSTDEWKGPNRNPLKPGYTNRPQHWALRFPAASLPGSVFDAASAGDNPVAPQIFIHKAAEWAVVLTDGVEKDSHRSVAKLRADLEVARRSEDKRFVPPIAHWSLDFPCLGKELAFHGGSGIRMLCQWGWEADLIRRGRLHYLFCGLSDDDGCQITATFPLDHPDLPDGSAEAEHLGRSVARYEELMRGFKNYSAEAVKWIERIADGFSPSLETLDGIIQSLEAKRWE